MWKGNVKSEDYHHEMDGEIFCHWFNQRLLPNVPGNSVIVLDRAPYHTLLTELSKGARTTWTREQVADWLIAHAAKDEDGTLLTKESLLTGEWKGPGPAEGRGRKRSGWPKQAMYQLACEMKPKPQYLFHEWCKSFNSAHGTDITVLLLPVAHPVLNPIELLWGQIKRYVRSHNHQFKMDRIEALVKEKRNQIGPDEWQASFRHSWSYAVDQWSVDEQLLEEEEEHREEAEDDPNDADADDDVE
jgi:transposase